MKKLLFAVFSLILLGLAWFYSDLWLDYQQSLDEQIEMQLNIDQLETDLVSIGDALAQEKSLGDSRSERIERLEKDLQEALKPVIMSLVHGDADAGERFVTQKTDLLFLPQKNQSKLAVVDRGNLVRVIEETQNTESKETYLYIEVPGAKPQRGYILKEASSYFTPNLESEVINPLGILAGKEVFKSLDEAAIILPKEVTCHLISRHDEGMVSVRTYDEEVFLTDEKNLVYPKSPIK